jgi:hypothetical protein
MMSTYAGGFNLLVTGSTDALKIDNIAIGSDKVNIPGDLVVDLKASLLKAVVTPTKVSIIVIIIIIIMGVLRDL